MSNTKEFGAEWFARVYGGIWDINAGCTVCEDRPRPGEYFLAENGALLNDEESNFISFSRGYGIKSNLALHIVWSTKADQYRWRGDGTSSGQSIVANCWNGVEDTDVSLKMSRQQFITSSSIVLCQFCASPLFSKRQWHITPVEVRVDPEWRRVLVVFGPNGTRKSCNQEGKVTWSPRTRGPPEDMALGFAGRDLPFLCQT